MPLERTHALRGTRPRVTSRKRAKTVPAPSERAPSQVREAFYTRALNIVRTITANAPEYKLTEALSASTDAGALARALSSSELIGAATQQLEPLVAIIAKGAEHKEQLIKEAGGLLTTQKVAAFLGISRQAVWKQRQDRKLLTVPHGGEEKFPAIQFTTSGDVLPGLSRVLGAIGFRGGWGTLDFLLTPDDDELGGLSPIDILKKYPKRLDELVRLAAMQGDHGPG